MEEQRLSSWRWGLYAVGLADSIFIPVVGGIVEKTGEAKWVVVLIILYPFWTITFGIFGMTFFERSSRFVLKCLYYSLCAMLPLAFFGSLGSDTSIHLWLPLSLTLGIFVGIAVRECWALVTWVRIRKVLLKALGETQSTLPLYDTRMPPIAAYSTYSFNTIPTYVRNGSSSSLHNLYYSEPDVRLLVYPMDNPWTTE